MGESVVKPFVEFVVDPISYPSVFSKISFLFQSIQIIPNMVQFPAELIFIERPFEYVVPAMASPIIVEL